MNSLIKEIKEQGEDYEFYPTTTEIIQVIGKDLKTTCRDRGFSILDIGAGNGNFFKVLQSINEVCVTKYAIEKSSILLKNLDPDIFIIGTDFMQQTLIDKKVDVIFCNPPYSEFEEWTEKILSEANAKFIYMVIPERWKNNEKLIRLIERRDITYKILGSFDFLEADRPARAKVNIIRFELCIISSYNDSLNSDPFDIWFDDFFKINQNPEVESDYEKEKKKKEEIRELIAGHNLIERLEELYLKDIENLYNNYRAIEKLDGEILKELGVNIAGLKEGLKLKIKGLKNLYWRELFDNLKSITDRLTYRSRDKLLRKLSDHTTVDFSASNAYAIVIWAIKNANYYIDEQLKDVYLWMSHRDNVQNYKSNTKFVEDGWRYDKSKMSHYKLDYRLVFKCFNNFNSSSFGNYDFPNGLSKSTHTYINDIITIGKNLGFSVYQDTYSFQWSPGKEIEFQCPDGIFMEIRAYKNGNIHCKMNQEFMKKLNIEAGRLNGWIKSKKEAAEELDIPIQEVERYYNTNLQIAPAGVKLLLI